jgi:hypothetical protein
MCAWSSKRGTFLVSFVLVLSPGFSVEKLANGDYAGATWLDVCEECCFCGLEEQLRFPLCAVMFWR